MIYYKKTDDPKDLLDDLNDLKEKGYIFRGLPNARYFLIPNAFREDSLAAMKIGYPISEHVIQENWISSSEFANRLMTLDPFKQNNPIVNHQTKVLCNYIIRMMRYNYWLHANWEKSDLTLLSNQEAELVKIRPSERFWINKADFFYFFEALYPSLFTQTTDDEIVHHQPICEDFAGVDETHPQHYGLRDGILGTTVLDWTSNPLHALHFAVDSEKNGKRVIADQAPIGAYLAICALKIVDPSTSPIIIEECGTSNIRAQAQEGLFTRFKSPCSYYLVNKGQFPSIEGFPGNVGFEVIKLNIERSSTNIGFFNEVLEREGVNGKKLFPDKGLI